MEILNSKQAKDSIKEMRAFMEGKKSDVVPDARAFGNMVIELLEYYQYKFESLEREQGPSSAFIDSSDVPHRLR